ncbi:MAG: organic hydroperoxide resistance protein [Hyphomicrobium zavarzinii]|jgi:Ohr subfamily peroxiredoxin|uniref:organic hydroperoxide resistance protein n=1 Tax=Hyphomicrobium TaxID=81 RepID=UPI00037E4D51|nr:MULTISPECIES: organic hydroperoxide resistance protein [Hyphomicrobium]MBL8846535.1 organic hydroperoxide resistance protein [Hyphomicrobium zavarzinii]WBT38716.1 organic hydroperoxide resistance protein [Hyphomicrobium sp. DMF-1]HML44244.1 organic hydroperoxide resistance protein [Hyphomicrobium zavarzinii]
MAYRTTATTKGGRDGRAVLADGKLALAMSLPKELGGSGEGHNPEQLFALGYSACFGQAILVLAKKHGLDGQAARVTADVTLNTTDGFSLAVDLKVSLPGADPAALQALVEEAHQICPYSKATRGNIPVTLSIA